MSIYISKKILYEYTLPGINKRKKFMPKTIIPAKGTVKKIPKILQVNLISLIIPSLSLCATNSVNDAENIFDIYPNIVPTAFGICCEMESLPIED